MTKQEAKQKILLSPLTDNLEPKTIRFFLEIIDEIDCEIKENNISEDSNG